jgi:hypothetical protein
MSEANRQPSERVGIPQQHSPPRSKSATPCQVERCCPGHDSWSTLYDHLRAQFPESSPQRVLSLLSQANIGMAAYGLDTATTLELAEIMTRFELGTNPREAGESTRAAV